MSTTTKAIPATKKITGNEFGAEITAYVNHKRSLYVEISIPNRDGWTGWITLNREKAIDLLNLLQEQIDQI